MRISTRLFLVLALVALITGPAGAADYDIDPVHSSALFKVKHLETSYFYGTFNQVAGTIQYDPANIGASSIDVTIDAGSVDSRNERRDEHIKSPDFLNTKQFPEIKFKSKKVADAGDGKLSITGDLTLHGVTKEITIEATKTGNGKQPRTNKELVGFETHFSVDRTDFDMGFMAGPLSAEVEFLLSVEAAAS